MTGVYLENKKMRLQFVDFGSLEPVASPFEQRFNAASRVETILVQKLRVPEFTHTL